MFDVETTETSLREWYARAEVDAGRGAPGELTTAEREELTRLCDARTSGC